jgi:hypothetical protein
MVGQGCGWPLVVTTLLTSDGWRVYAGAGLYPRSAELDTKSSYMYP